MTNAKRLAVCLLSLVLVLALVPSNLGTKAGAVTTTKEELLDIATIKDTADFPVSDASIEAGSKKIKSDYLSLSTLTDVNGRKDYSNSVLGAYILSNNEEKFALRVAEKDGRDTVLVKPFDWCVFTPQYGFKFTKSVKASEIDKLEIELYANISKEGKGEYIHALGGIHAYPLDATGAAGEGYMIPGNVTQRQWTTLTISGDDLAKMADASGNITGLQFGYAVMANVAEAANFVDFADIGIWIASVKAVKSTVDTTVANGDSLLLDVDAVADTADFTIGGNKVEGSKMLASAYRSDNTLTLVAGNGAFAGDSMPNLTGFGEDQYQLQIAKKDGAAALLYKPYWHSVMSPAYGIKFTNAVNLADVDSVTMEIYVNFSTEGNYKTGNGGVRLYPLDATGAAGEGWMIPTDIQQRQWVKVTFTGDELAKLADASGKLSGLQFGSAIAYGWGDPGNFIKLNPHAEGSSELYIRSITAHTHNLTEVTANPANCNEGGNIQYWTCDKCGNWYSDAEGTAVIADHNSVNLPANGHNPSAWKHDDNQHWKECLDCNEEIENSRADHVDENGNGLCDICDPNDGAQNPDATGDTTIVVFASCMLLISAAFVVAMVTAKKRFV